MRLFICAALLFLFSPAAFAACGGALSKKDYKNVVSQVKVACDQAASQGASCGDSEGILDQACDSLGEIAAAVEEINRTGKFSGPLTGINEFYYDEHFETQSQDHHYRTEVVQITQSFSQRIIQQYLVLSSVAKELEALTSSSSFSSDTDINAHKDYLMNTLIAQLNDLSASGRSLGNDILSESKNRYSCGCGCYYDCDPNADYSDSPGDSDR